MKMGKIEKKFVNSRIHAQKNFKLIEQFFNCIDAVDIKNVLEIGCGVGIVTSNLSGKYNLNIIGIDIDSGQIESAKKYHTENENLKFSEADAANLPFGNKQFDMVVSQNVFHHINKWDSVIKEISRVLKPGGYFIFTDFAYSKFTVKIFKRIVKSYGVYTISEVINTFKRNSLEIALNQKPQGLIWKNYSVLFQKKYY
jgi:ubiquinone/menaquinone biosynthesis C-methylase UbiE